MGELGPVFHSDVSRTDMRRPEPTIAPSSPRGLPSSRLTPLPRALACWVERLTGRFRDAAESLGPCGAGRVLDEFAGLVAAARGPEPVEAGLVRLAGELSGACRVELVFDRDQAEDTDPEPVAVWPEGAEAMAPGRSRRRGLLSSGSVVRRPLPDDAAAGAPARRGWPRRVVRRLTNLCALAAAAERGLHVDHRARARPRSGAGQRRPWCATPRS